MAIAQLDLAAFIEALDQARMLRGKTWRDVAHEADVSASTLSRMRRGHRPDVNGFASLVRWLGAPADDFLQRETPKPGTLSGLVGLWRAEEDDGSLTDIDAVVYG